jgi:hypothetical protein
MYRARTMDRIAEPPPDGPGDKHDGDSDQNQEMLLALLLLMIEECLPFRSLSA